MRKFGYLALLLGCLSTTTLPAMANDLSSDAVQVSSAASTADGSTVKNSPYINHITSLDELQKNLAQYSIVRGQFTQLRNMAMFAKPLQSQGSFVLAQKQGLLWTQQVPFNVNLVLTANKLSQRFAQQPAQIITAEENPMAFYFSHIFLSVFNGDTQQLQQHFVLKFSHDQHGWQLQLTPKQAPLNAVFSHITLTGRNTIDRLVLKEIRGDSTEIQFHQQTHQPEKLTDAEQSQFQF